MGNSKRWFFIWIRIKSPFKVKRLFEKALAKGILINPGSIYAEHSGQFIRISYGFASLDNIKKVYLNYVKLLKINNYSRKALFRSM